MERNLRKPAEPMRSDDHQPDLGDKYFTVTQVANSLGVKDTTIQEWIRTGKLRAIKPGKSYLISQTAIKEFISEQEAIAYIQQLQQEDPGAKWERTRCISCVKRLVNTTHYERIHGYIYCSDCNREAEPSKDEYERLAQISLREYNATNHSSILGLEPCALYRCGVCNRPQIIAVYRLLEQPYIPECTHHKPFSAPNMEHKNAVNAMMRTRAELVLDLRLKEERSNDYPAKSWMITGCIHCAHGLEYPALRSVVTNREQRLSGYIQCIGCDSGNEPFKVTKNYIDILIHELEEIDVGTNYIAKVCPCRCSKELWSCPDNDEQELALSWCEKRSEDERRALISAWLKRWELEVSHSLSSILRTQQLLNLSKNKGEGLDDVPF